MSLFMWIGVAQSALFFARSIPAETVCYADWLFSLTYFRNTDLFLQKRANL